MYLSWKLVINEYRKDEEDTKEYSTFIDTVFKQIVKAVLNKEIHHELLNNTYAKNEDTVLSDLIDRVEDSVSKYYAEYQQSMFCDMLAEKLANKNYPVVESVEDEAIDNLLAKNLYYQILRHGNTDLIDIAAPKIDKHIENAKKKLS